MVASFSHNRTVSLVRVRAVAGVLVVLFVCAALASASLAKSRYCGTIRAQMTTFGVTVSRGRTACRTARRILDDFLRGKGQMHGPASGPSYLQWWAVGGWRCGYGAGGGGCSHHGARIIAQQLASTRVFVSTNAGGSLLKVKPQRIHLLSNEDLSHLVWRSWGGKSATATGLDHANSPSPGQPATNPVRVIAKNKRQCGGVLVYTTIEECFTNGVPYAGQPNPTKYAYGCPTQ